MRQSMKFLIALPIAMGLAAPATSEKADDIKLTDRQQKKLDARLAGRTKGKPVSCITRFDRKNMTVISDDVILFGRSRNANTIYVNKPYRGCNGAEDNALVMRSFSGQICKGEIVRVRDLVSRAFYGSCSWGEFVPYTKDES